MSSLFFAFCDSVDNYSEKRDDINEFLYLFYSTVERSLDK